MTFRPPPELATDAHKGNAGVVLFICGSALMPGAAILSLRAALRAGAGLVTLGCLDRELFRVVPPAAPEATYLDLSSSHELGTRRDHARVAGCGMGRSERTRAVVDRLLEDDFEGPLVLDADALNVLAGVPEALRSRTCGPTVITPHPLEAERLLSRPIPADPQGRSEAARELARVTGSICCLKGAGTVITDGEKLAVNGTGNPGMATAGSGDVLSGILGAYLARCGESFTPFDAAVAAVHVHGASGDLAAAKLGERSVIASDLIDFLPAAQRALADLSPEA